MKDLLNYLLTNIVDHAEAIKIDEATDETGTVILKVEVHPEDVGKVIGKKGKIINSIRNLIRVKAVKLQQRVRVEVVNPPLAGQSPAPAAAAPAPAPAVNSEVDQIVGSEEANPAQPEEPAETPEPTEVDSAAPEPTE